MSERRNEWRESLGGGGRNEWDLARSRPPAPAQTVPAYNFPMNGSPYSRAGRRRALCPRCPFGRQLESPRAARVSGRGGQTPTRNVTWRQRWRLLGRLCVFGGKEALRCGCRTQVQQPKRRGDEGGTRSRRGWGGGCYKNNSTRHMHTSAKRPSLSKGARWGARRWEASDGSALLQRDGETE